MGVVEVRAVIDGRLGGWRAAEDGGLPGVAFWLGEDVSEPPWKEGGGGAYRWLSKWMTEMGP